MDSSWVIVGKITKPVGLKGFVSVVLFSDNPDRFCPDAEVFIKSPGDAYKPVRVVDVQLRSKFHMINVQFEGCATREDAEQLSGRELFIPLSKRAPLPDDRFYPDEIADMDLLSEEGSVEGKVVRLEAESPAPYLVVQTTSHGELMIPFRKDFIARVDRKKRHVQLSSPIDRHIPE